MNKTPISFTALIGALGGLILALGATTASAIVIDPAQCGISLSCDSGPETGTSVINGIIAGLYPGITEVYKQDQGGGETGSFATDYTTQFFNTPTDPQEALVTWDGPNIINCPNCFVLVKDGNANPAWYLININSWDGMENLDLQNFWPAQGAISHVSIWTQPIPVPAAVWLFGSGLLGLIGVAKRKKV
jgi:hypothetical protein